MIYKCFLDLQNRIKKFHSCSNFDLNRIPGHYEKFWKFTNFEVCPHSLSNCDSQSKWSNTIVNMISFFRWMEQNKEVLVIFKDLTKSANPDLSRNLENWQSVITIIFDCKTDLQVFSWYVNGTEIKSFGHFEILTKIAYQSLSRNLQID